MKIGVLLSGGLDSSTAAFLLKKQGHEVIAITMRNGKYDPLAAAEESAGEIGLAHHIIDLSELFQDRVINYFCQTYARGETPNPCVVCNRYIKFGALLDYAKSLGCEKIATGHYANITYDPSTSRYQLRKGADPKKDQSYFLYDLSQEQLSYTIFPLGALTKEEVKTIAREQNIKALNNRESQEICFISDDYRDLLKEEIVLRPGAIVDLSGNRLGTHQGVAWYTVGQRKGLRVSWSHPLYVTDLDPENNLVIVGKETDLYKKVLWSAYNNFVSVAKFEEPLLVKAKIRYRANEAPAWIYPEGNLARVEFIEPQRAITKGQAIVYYDGDIVVGGGRIHSCG